MNKEVITEKQGIALIILYSVGTSSIIVTAIEAQNDLWISIILTILIMIPMGFVYGKLGTIFPGKDMFDVLYLCWGRLFGRIILVFYIWYFVNVSMFILKDLGEFFSLTVGFATPMVIPMMGSMLVSVFAVKGGIEVLGRTASFFLLPIIFLIFLDFSLLLPSVDIHNMQPVLYNGWGPVFKGVLDTMSFPLGEVVAFTFIFHTLKDRKKINKTYIKGIVTSGVIILIASSITVLVIGSAVASTYYFSAFTAISRINVGNSLQSIEILVSFLFTIGGFTKFSILFLCSAKSISSLFNIDDYRLIVIPLGILVLNLALFMFKNISEFYRFTSQIWPYYAIPFQVVFPIITLILAKMKSRKKQTQKS